LASQVLDDLLLQSKADMVRRYDDLHLFVTLPSPNLMGA
jgi:hypothetical protein